MPHPFRRSLVLSVLFLALFSVAARAENWPQWRGPRGDGSAEDPQLPIKWSATENIQWKVKVPAAGHASPIIWDQHVFLAGVKADETLRTLTALNRSTGEVLWEKQVLKAPLERIHKLNSHASSTPATDGKRVYVSFLNEKKMHVTAYDFQGQEAWHAEPGVFSSVHGYCSSPILFENLVIINGDHDGDAYLVALDRETGHTVWKTPRENKTRSYCTPIIREVGGKMHMLLSGSKCVASYDPRTGERHWIIDGPTEQFVASLVYRNDLLYVTGGFPDRHILAINPNGSGNITKTHIVWHHLRSGVSYVPSPVAIGDYFLVAADDGVGTCFEARTGKIAWQKRLAGHYSGSLLTANGLVYFIDDDGVTKVVKPGPELEIVATNELGDATFASPAASDGQLFIRGEDYLWCIGKK